MTTEDFTTTITVSKTPKEAFDAINNVREWWSENIEGRTDKLNSEFIYRDRYLTAKMKITHFSHRKIVWDVIKSHNEFFSDKDKDEWDGTKIIFEISQKDDNNTEVKFTHAGLVPQFVCFDICSNSWEFFIATSLKSLIETGEGKDISKDENSYTTSFVVEQSPEEVYEAINNVRGWWSEGIEGKTNELNEEFFYHYKEVHLTKMKIVELIPNEKVVWFVKDNYFDFVEDKTEWEGTKIVFEISKEDNKTQITFTHHGLVPEYECYEACKEGWGNYINSSLHSLVTVGKGQPNPKGQEGDFNEQLLEKYFE